MELPEGTMLSLPPGVSVPKGWTAIIRKSAMNDQEAKDHLNEKKISEEAYRKAAKCAHDFFTEHGEEKLAHAIHEHILSTLCFMCPADMKEIKSGDKVEILESLWECLDAGEHRTVFADDEGKLWINCRQGKHYLDVDEKFSNPLVKKLAP
jgi:hypothetical protein